MAAATATAELVFGIQWALDSNAKILLRTLVFLLRFYWDLRDARHVPVSSGFLFS